MKISHGVRNSLAASCGFAWCAKFHTVCEIVFHSVLLLVLQLLLFLISHVMRNFRMAMRKCWVLDFFLWFSSLHLWLDWKPIAKLSKGLWSAPKLRFFMYLSFNLPCHGFHKILPHYEVLQSSDFSCIWASTCLAMDFTKFSLILGLFQWSNSYQKHQNFPKTD